MGVVPVGARRRSSDGSLLLCASVARLPPVGDMNGPLLMNRPSTIVQLIINVSNELKVENLFI